MSTNNLVPIGEIERMAISVAKSKLFGCETIEQAISLMLVAQAEGLHPVKAVQEYHIIKGRPAMKADAMLSRFQRSGGSIRYHNYTDEEVSATLTHPQGGEITITWTIDMAKRAGLTGKDIWKSYPRQMLRSRVISEGVRCLFPGIATGIYTPEEIDDIDELNSHVTTIHAADTDEGIKIALRQAITSLRLTKSDSRYKRLIDEAKRAHEVLQAKIVEVIPDVEITDAL